MHKFIEFIEADQKLAKFRVDSLKKSLEIVEMTDKKAFNQALPKRFQSYAGLEDYFNDLADTELPLIEYLKDIEENGFFDPNHVDFRIQVTTH